MGRALSVRPMGDRAQLLELEGNAAVHEAAAALRAGFGKTLVEVVPADRTVLLVWASPPPTADAIQAALSASRSTGDGVCEMVQIDVIYDGTDLEAVADRLGVDRDDVIRLHCGPEYRVAFVGFAPGFPYLVGLPHELVLPRLATPRTRVPAGSVAVAAGYCGIYPRASPGGWNLLGRTGAVMFDAERNPPALLAPGMRVRFRAATGV
ncbi:MAG: 5-oxoprolinase subunit B family protein [Solirubrobacteraceae bacterium]